MLAILTGWVIVFPQTGDGDAIMHFLNARDGLWKPALLLGSWARVGDKIPLLIPAQLGIVTARWAAALISVICAWQTIRLAEDLEIPHAHLAGVFLIFQPYVFTLAADTMTELPLALGIVIAIRLWMKDRVWASCIVMGYLPTVRPEGFFLCTLWGAMLIYRRRLGPLLVLGWGTLAWFVACWIFWGNPTYFFREGWSWPADSLRIYGHGTIFAYADRWPLYCGPLLFVLFVGGLYSGIVAAKPPPLGATKNKSFALGVSVFLLIFVLHSVLWWRGWFASCGLMRIMACVAPITAIVCLYGWNMIGPPIGRWGRGLALTTIMLTAMAYYVVEPRHQRIFSLQRTCDYAAQHDVLTSAPMIIFGDPMAQAALRIGPNPPNVLRNDCDWFTECNHLLHAPLGSAGFWDNQHSQEWFRVSVDQLPTLGYTILYRTEYRPRLAIEWLEPLSLPREQVYVVIRKDRPGKMPTD